MTKEPAPEERVLRAKYLDWCSARVADHFLALTPDEIYEIAHGPAVEANENSRQPSRESPRQAPDNDPDLGYLGLVRRAAEVLALRLQLPTFEEWSSSYGADPKVFDDELLGLWQGWNREGADQG